MDWFKFSRDMRIALCQCGQVAKRFKGKVTIETSIKVFDEGTEMISDTEPELIPKGAVIVNADSIYSISPGPDAGEQVG